MKKIILSTTTLMIMSINTYGESLAGSLENTEDSPEFCTVQQNRHQPIEVRSVRSVLGENDLMEHTNGQLRTGYISFSQDDAPRASAYALGGHFHFNTKRWNAFMVGAEVYTVLNLGVDQDPLHLNGDFFDENGKSFMFVSQAYLDWKWCNTEIKLGRQSLDTPHADSDDIRMMPNYFEAYTITNTDIDNLTLRAGLIDKMAGWENAVNSAEFVDVGETLGVDQNIDGIYYASASYEGIKDLSLNLWYYHYSDIANVIYAEAGYTYELSKSITFTLGLQYDGSHETGAALLGKQDAQTYGISIESQFEDLGLTVLAAYNQDSGETGAMGLSLGGGAFFTSMEDQTLDALGTAGKAWMIGGAYDFGKMGMDDLSFGLAYGNFEADDDAVYKSREIDAVLDYSWSEKFSVTAAFASVDFKAGTNEDYDQFRMIANYNF